MKTILPVFVLNIEGLIHNFKVSELMNSHFIRDEYDFENGIDFLRSLPGLCPHAYIMLVSDKSKYSEIEEYLEIYGISRYDALFLTEKSSHKTLDNAKNHIDTLGFPNDIFYIGFSNVSYMPTFDNEIETFYFKEAA